MVHRRASFAALLLVFATLADGATVTLAPSADAFVANGASSAATIMARRGCSGFRPRESQTVNSRA